MKHIMEECLIHLHVHTAMFSFEINHNNHFKEFVFVFCCFYIWEPILICFVLFLIKFGFCLLRFNIYVYSWGYWNSSTSYTTYRQTLVGVKYYSITLLLHRYMILFALNRLFILSFSICTVPESIKYVIGIYCVRGRLSFCRSAGAAVALVVILQ